MQIKEMHVEDIALVLPHYSKFISKFSMFEETCCAYEKEKNIQVIRLNDGDGVFIDSDVYICKA